MFLSESFHQFTILVPDEDGDRDDGKQGGQDGKHIVPQQRKTQGRKNPTGIVRMTQESVDTGFKPPPLLWEDRVDPEVGGKVEAAETSGPLRKQSDEQQQEAKRPSHPEGKQSPSSHYQEMEPRDSPDDEQDEEVTEKEIPLGQLAVLRSVLPDPAPAV